MEDSRQKLHDDILLVMLNYLAANNYCVKLLDVVDLLLQPHSNGVYGLIHHSRKSQNFAI